MTRNKFAFFVFEFCFIPVTELLEGRQLGSNRKNRRLNVINQFITDIKIRFESFLIRGLETVFITSIVDDFGKLYWNQSCFWGIEELAVKWQDEPADFACRSVRHRD